MSSVLLNGVYQSHDEQYFAKPSAPDVDVLVWDDAPARTGPNEDRNNSNNNLNDMDAVIARAIAKAKVEWEAERAAANAPPPPPPPPTPDIEMAVQRAVSQAREQWEAEQHANLQRRRRCCRQTPIIGFLLFVIGYFAIIIGLFCFSFYVGAEILVNQLTYKGTFAFIFTVGLIFACAIPPLLWYWFDLGMERKFPNSRFSLPLPLLFWLLSGCFVVTVLGIGSMRLVPYLVLQKGYAVVPSLNQTEKVIDAPAFNWQNAYLMTNNQSVVAANTQISGTMRNLQSSSSQTTGKF